MLSLLTKDEAIFIKRSCQYKVRHECLKDALLSLFEKRDKKIDVDSCYRCVACGGWHIGHRNKKYKKRSRLRKRMIDIFKKKGNVYLNF